MSPTALLVRIQLFPTDYFPEVTRHYREFVTFMRVFFSVLWAVLLAGLIINTYMNQKHKHMENPMMRRLAQIGNSSLIILAFCKLPSSITEQCSSSSLLGDRILWNLWRSSCLDFFHLGMYSVSSSVDHLLQCSWSLVWLHHFHLIDDRIEVYSSAVASLKKEIMLSKINSSYSKDVTIDDVVDKVRFLRKLKWPFIVIVILGFIIDIVYLIMRAIHPWNEGIIITYVWTVYYTFCWFMYAFGFVIYGFRLVRLLPPEVSGRMAQVSLQLEFQLE